MISLDTKLQILEVARLKIRLLFGRSIWFFEAGVEIQQEFQVPKMEGFLVSLFAGYFGGTGFSLGFPLSRIHTAYMTVRIPAF